MNDDDLKKLLTTWQAPSPRETLDDRVLASYRERTKPRPRWTWLFTGTLRVPVPVAAAAVFLFAALSIVAFRGLSRERPAAPAPEELARQVPKITDFKPVAVLQPRIVRRSHAQQN